MEQAIISPSPVATFQSPSSIISSGTAFLFFR